MYKRQVQSVRRKTTQPHMQRAGVGFRMGEHQIYQRLALLLIHELPGGVPLLLGGVGQPVVQAILDQLVVLVEEGDLLLHLGGFLVAQLVQVQLVAESAGHGGHRTGPQTVSYTHLGWCIGSPFRWKS